MLLAGPISHTSTQYMDFVEIFNIVLDLSVIFLLLVGGELWSQVKIVLLY